MSEKRKCKGCGKSLMFVPGENGKIVPLDMVAPVYEVTKDLTGNEVAKRVGGSIMVSHFATCSKANDFSSSKRK